MASTNLERKHAFVFSEEDVNKIWRVLSDNVGEVEAEVSCSDDVNRTFHSPDALKAYENARRSSIVSMRIRAVPSDFSKRASMSFARRKYGPPVEFEIEGPEDAVVRSKSQLTDVIDGMRPWYSFLARLDFFLVAMILATFMFSVGLLVSNDAGEVSEVVH